MVKAACNSLQRQRPRWRQVRPSEWFRPVHLLQEERKVEQAHGCSHREHRDNTRPHGSFVVANHCPLASYLAWDLPIRTAPSPFSDAVSDVYTPIATGIGPRLYTDSHARVTCPAAGHQSGYRSESCPTASHLYTAGRRGRMAEPRGCSVASRDERWVAAGMLLTRMLQASSNAVPCYLSRSGR